MTFSGFPKETTRFLARLSRNNNKKWFSKHRDEYEAYYLEPAKAFVEAIGDRLQKFSPGTTAQPKVNGSIFRINRDLRFTKDKKPYRPHLDLWFWHGNARVSGNSGYYFRLASDRVFLGAGSHGMTKSKLVPFRKAVAKEATGKELEKLIAKFQRAGYDLPEPKYKRVPKPFDPNHPRGDLLRYDAMYATIEERLPPELTSKKFVTWAANRFKKVAPLHNWLIAV